MNNTTTASQYRILVGFSCFIILLGVLLIPFGISMLKDAYASRSWPVAEGKVQNIRVTWDSSSQRTGSRKRSYYFQITYTYMVDNQTYSNNRFSLGDGPRAGKKFSDEDEARTVAQTRYPIGSKVNVSYEPGNPESTVLQPGANWGTYVPLLMGVLCLLGGLFFLYFVRKYVGSIKQNTE